MGTVHHPKHYTIPKGICMFRLNAENSFEDLGNANKFDISVEIEEVEHYSSRVAEKTRDLLIVTQVKMTGSMTLESRTKENLQRYFFAEDIDDQTQASATGETADLVVADADMDRWLAMGVYDVSNLVVKNAAETTTYELGSDYAVNLTHGLIMPLSTGNMVAETAKLTYDQAAKDYYDMDAVSLLNRQGHIWVIGDPTAGAIQDFKAYGALKPTGTYSMIGDEIAGMDFDIEILDHADYPNLAKVTYHGARDVSVI